MRLEESSNEGREQPLGLADPEYLGTTCGARTARGRALVLQSDLSWVLDLNLFSAFDTIGLRHCLTPPFRFLPMYYQQHRAWLVIL